MFSKLSHRSIEDDELGILYMNNADIAAVSNIYSLEFRTSTCPTDFANNANREDVCMCIFLYAKHNIAPDVMGKNILLFIKEYQRHYRRYQTVEEIYNSVKSLTMIEPFRQYIEKYIALV